MTENKVRVWDAGEMLYTGFVLNPNGVVFRSDDFPKSMSFFAHENASVMQYTGLKDVNGVEIYKGDVLECRDQRIGNRLGTSFRAKVEWSEKGHWALWAESHDTLGLWHYHASCKVLGNIYEHPELVDGHEHQAEGKTNDVG